MDIVYTDLSGQLQTWLYEQNVDQSPPDIRATDARGQATPIKFILEIKTTTGNFDDHMFMSNAQYNRVCRRALGFELEQS